MGRSWGVAWRLTTANSPEMEMAWPAIPTVARRSDAIGVKRLTGMNSDAISIAAHIAMDPTALHTWRLETVDWSISVDIEFPLSRCAGTNARPKPSKAARIICG
jgi:hypothetical protein